MSGQSEAVTAESTAPYYTWFAVLAVLAFAALGVSFSGLDGGTRLILNLVIGSVSASILGYHFMHLKGGEQLTWLVVASGLFWMAILFVLTLTDYVTRYLGVV
jgi:cytochrome c oxidase subunit 4